MDIQMNGRTAIVTGASKGLGLAVATQFSACGAEVVIAARGADALEAARRTLAETHGAKIAAVQCDVSTAEGVRQLYDGAMQAFGKVDIIVNNAGVSRASPFEATTDEEWQADLDLKLFAAIRLTRLVWPQMKERRWGRIINVLNTGAKAPGLNSLPSTASRAAGMALTKALSKEGAPFGVLVNALLVGRIESDQWVRKAEKTGVDLDAVLAEMGADIPAGRVGRADEFASIACFLASDLASYIAGTAINVDGGASPVV